MSKLFACLLASLFACKAPPPAHLTPDAAASEPVRASPSSSAPAETPPSPESGERGETPVAEVSDPQPAHGIFPGPAEDVAALRKSPLVVVARLEATFSECSGLGGLHAVFRYDGPTAAAALRAHAGGHGIWSMPGVGRDMGAGRRAVTDERWFVLGLQPSHPVGADHDGNPDSSVRGWCLDEMPPTDAAVLAMVPMPDRQAAEAAAESARH